MAIDFPNAPSTNDTYTVGNKTWIYDGTTWNTYNTTSFSAETLPGTTIKSTVTGSSLTSVGTLGSLAVTGATTSGSFVQGTDYLSPYQGLRNKIINGDMRIAQRGTATITGSGSQQFPVDRISVYNGTGTVTFVQSSTAPAGFAYSLLATVTATGSYTTAGYTEIVQYIESANVSDFAFGTASASPVTISFWVRSSLSGSYDVSIRNSAANRSNRTTFAVAAGEVNTWVKKSVTFAGDTSGTWTNDTTTAFVVGINLGHGTNYDNTADTWTSTNSPSTSGSIDFAANSGATFYLTGLQVERGSVATPFEQRPIQQELALCQRYYQRFQVESAGERYGIGYGVSANQSIRLFLPFITQMRIKPHTFETTATATDYSIVTAATINVCVYVPSLQSETTKSADIAFYVASGITNSFCYMGRAATTSSYLGFSAEF